MKILFCGDIMPGGVISYQDEFVSDEVISHLSRADFRVGTLECALGNNIPFDTKKMALPYGKNIVYAPESSIKILQKLDFNVVSLANNHIFDLGYEGLKNTIKLLEGAGIKYCGAGDNIKEASKPCYVECDGKTIAFIGCCFYNLPPYVVEAATETTPGIFQTQKKEIINSIISVKQTCDFLIILPHWGKEYCYMPPDECLPLAKTMIDAGADAVMGSHTHIINPKILYKEKPIYFSMGNFLFPDFCLQVPRPIYYPKTKEEAYSLPIVLNYPKKIDVPTRVVWDTPSRIGYISTISFENRITISDIFCKLSENNVLEILRGEAEILEREKMMKFAELYAGRLRWEIRYFKKNIKEFLSRVLNKISRIFKRLVK